MVGGELNEDVMGDTRGDSLTGTGRADDDCVDVREELPLRGAEIDLPLERCGDGEDRTPLPKESRAVRLLSVGVEAVYPRWQLSWSKGDDGRGQFRLRV